MWTVKEFESSGMDGKGFVAVVLENVEKEFT